MSEEDQRKLYYARQARASIGMSGVSEKAAVWAQVLEPIPGHKEASHFQIMSPFAEPHDPMQESQILLEEMRMTGQRGPQRTTADHH